MLKNQEKSNLIFLIFVYKELLADYHNWCKIGSAANAKITD